MSEFKKRVTKKRLVRLTIVTFVLIIIFNILRLNGLWIDPPKYLEMPEFFGSIWFNLLASILPGIAMIIYEEWDYSPKNTFILFIIVLMVPFTLVIGLYVTIVGFTIMIMLLGIAGCINSIVIGIWKLIPRTIKDGALQIVKKTWKFIYPDE